MTTLFSTVVKRATLLISFLVCSSFLHAQLDSIYIVGPQEVCFGECGTYSIYPDSLFQTDVVEYVWQVNGAVVSTEYPAYICWQQFAGTVMLTLDLIFSTGEYITLEYPVIIFDGFYTEIIPLDNSNCINADSTFCQRVCTGATANYTLPNQFGEVIWEVQGAESFTADFNNLTVEWGAPGSGIITAIVVDDFCQGSATFCVDIIDNPTAGFTTIPPPDDDGVLRICEGQTVYFENTTTNAVSYEWTLGNGTSDETSPAQTYPTPGTYEVILVAFNECFCTDTTSMTIEVEDAQSPFVDCVGTICEGETVTYTSAAACGTYYWTVSANGTITDGGGMNDDFVTIDWGSGPSGTIELVVEDCASIDYCLEPNFILIPILSDDAVIEGPEIVCRGSEVTYSTIPYEGTEFSWAVSGFGTIISGQGTNEITVAWSDAFFPTNAQSVSVDYQNCYLECGGSAMLTVNVEPEFYVSGPIEVCENDVAQHTAIDIQTNMPFDCNWTVYASDGSTVWTSPAPIGTPSIDWNFGPGAYRLEAIPANPTDYCVDGYELPINLLAAPPPVTSIVGETNICPGIPYAYEATGEPDHNFRWEANDGSNITTYFGNPVNISWGNSGPYELTVVQISTSGLACESDPISINLQPISGFTISGDLDVCQDQTSIYSTAVYENVDYQWTITPDAAGTIVDDPNSSTIEILWHVDGTATVGLEVCGEVTSQNVEVFPRPRPVVNHPSDLCPNEVAAVQTTTSYDSYTWKDENGGTVSTLANPDLGPGYYQVEVVNEFGCIGDTTFHIKGYPQSEVYISTPDNTGFCPGDPPTTLYALNSDAGYDYQWFHDGNPVGTNSPTYTTDQYGSYWVEIVDINGCTASSNTIVLFEWCGFGGGICNGGTCNFVTDCEPGTLVSFDILPSGICNERTYMNTSTGVIPGTIEWNFDDPWSGNNFADVPHPSHTFSRAGFFVVVLTADVDDPDNPGNPLFCWDAQVDTVELAANFHVDNGCPGEEVAFSDLSTFLPFTSIASWSWDFGDPGSGADNNSMDPNPIHIYAVAGTYTVTLTATSSSGCTSSMSKTLDVYPPPSVNFEEPEVLCQATALNFVADVPSTVTYVEWDFGDPSSGAANTSEGFDTYHAFDAIGTYTVTLFAQSIYGCTNTFSRTVTIEPNTLNGDITLSVPSPICEGDSTLLTSPVNGVSWIWSTGEDSESIWVKEAGVYQVTVTDAEGCMYSPDPAVIDVIPAPTAPIRAVETDDFGQPLAYFYDNYEVCEGEDVFLESIDIPGYNYQWNNGDPGLETEYSEARGNQLTPGDHDIFVTVTDTGTGCSNEIGPFVVTVHPLPADVQISANPGGVICESVEATFSVNNPDGALTYIWNTGETGTSITTSLEGEYYVTAYNEFGCAKESNHLQIVPGPDISKIPSGCHTRCRPDTICLPPLPGVISFQWYFNGNPVPGGTDPELIAEESGDYWVEMVSANGCSLTSGVLTLDLFDGFGNIGGNVYFDVNDNGIIDAADTLMSGIDIILFDGMTPLQTASSNVDGAYEFTNILSTEYTLEVDTLNLPENVGYTIYQVQTELVGCDVEEQVDWLLRLDCEPAVNNLEFTLCEGEAIDFEGTTLASDTTFTQTFLLPSGCDSMLTVNVTMLPADQVDLALSTCVGSTITYNGTVMNPGDQMDFTLQNQNGCDSVVTVSVSALPDDMVALALEVCPGERIEYNGQTLTEGMSDEFVFINQYGCDSVVQVSVAAYPEIEFTLQSVPSCPGETSGMITAENLTGGTPPYTLSLDGVIFEPAPVLSGVSAGAYSLIVADQNGCTVEEDVNVEELPALEVAVEEFILPCDKLEATLGVQLLSGMADQVNYLWSDGSTNPELTVNEIGSYGVIISDACTSIEQQIEVRLEEEGRTDFMYVPNAFSPNQDGINDRFKAFPGQDVLIEDYQLNVFDRWGNQVFATDDAEEGWKGQFRGRTLNTGVYIWHLEAKVMSCGQMIDVEIQGDVVLVK